MRSHTVGDGPHSLHVDIEGNGPAIVMYPSLARPGRDFHRLAGDLAAAGFRSVMVNPQGTDEHPTTPTATSLHDLADAVWRIVDDLQLAEVHLLGHAFGNRVVRCAAADRPGVARTVILVGAGGRVPPEPEAATALARCVSFDAGDDEREAAAGIAFFANGHCPPQWRTGWFPAVGKAQGEASLNTRAEEWWDAGGTPMLVIQGLADRIAPPENGRILATTHPDAELVDIPDAGHALLPEQPELIAESIIDFLHRRPVTHGNP